MLEYKVYEVGGVRSALEGMRYAFKSIPNSNRESDLQRADALNTGGNPHNKFLRQIIAWIKVKADFTFWKQMDTYRFGVDKNSSSTMHTLTKSPISYEDFGLTEREYEDSIYWHFVIDELESIRLAYHRETDPAEKKKLELEMFSKLPMSYQQERLISISYAALQKIMDERKDHKNPDWNRFLTVIDALPANHLIKRTEPEPFILNNDHNQTNPAPVWNGYGNQPTYQHINKLKMFMDGNLFNPRFKEDEFVWKK